MQAIAVYSPKGGVGKTTLSVNLAWCAATLSARRTLVWDLDPQGASTFLLGHDRALDGQARAVFARDVSADGLIVGTAIDRLDLLPADTSLRGLDLLLHGLGKRKRLNRLLETLAGRFDRVILDCPPGLTETAEQVVRAAAIEVEHHFVERPARQGRGDDGRDDQRGGGRRPAMLPVFGMADRRRSVHNAALAADPDWPVIPMASVVETMATRRQPLGAFAPTSPPARAVAGLWTAIERRLAG